MAAHWMMWAGVGFGYSRGLNSGIWMAAENYMQVFVR
jgi:hypothetical protein